MKTGVLIPTRGDREKFLNFAQQQIQEQTVKPDEVCIVDYKPVNSAPDITKRYKDGLNELKKRGCEIVLFWEDDDFYAPYYIEEMLRLHQQHGSPDIFGVDSTIYYNIFTRKWAMFKHPGRSSMMNTLVRTKALEGIKWCDDSYSFTDMHLWKTLKGKSISVDKPLAVGIKHGIGLCGGGGHVNNWKAFSNYDADYSELLKFTNAKALNFYQGMTAEIKSYKLTHKPFLTIVTRVMAGKRNGLFAKHKQSISALNSTDYEQIFVIDRHQSGLLAANTSFQFVKPKGEFVYLLDDDDFIVEHDFVDLLKTKRDADVIFFKMKILTGDGDQIYPKPQSWGTRQPKRGQIGGSCFAVKRWVYERYIHHFAHPSFGDWNFITKVLSDNDVKIELIDTMMAETGKVSRGQAE